MRVLVCGGRDYADASRLWTVLDAIHRKHPINLLIHGGAMGADTLAGEWALARGVGCWRCPAEWGKHGKSAGPIRNRQMLEHGKPNMVVAFPGGRGTANMVSQARAAGVEVIENHGMEAWIL